MGDRFFQKLGQDVLRGNVKYMKLPLDIKGMYGDFRLMVDDNTWKDGTFPLGSSKKATVDDVIEFYSDDTRAKGNYVRKCLDRLVKAGVITISGKDVIHLCTFVDEQNLGNPEANRKREKAEDELLSLVNRAGTVVRGVYRRSNAKALPYDMLVTHLTGTGRLEEGKRIYKPKAREILKRMLESGVLVCLGDGLYSLASLASPPVSGAGAGAGPEHSASRNIPVEPEPEPEPEREGRFTPQLEAGQLEERPSGRDRPHGAHSPDAGSGGGRSERSEGGARDPTDSADWMYEPGDAFRVPDPVHAAVLYLRTMPGWQERSGTGDNEASSKAILLNKWSALVAAMGVQDADALWRSLLREIFEDKYDKTWKSYVKIFVSRVNKSGELKAE